LFLISAEVWKDSEHSHDGLLLWRNPAQVIACESELRALLSLAEVDAVWFANQRVSLDEALESHRSGLVAHYIHLQDAT